MSSVSATIKGMSDPTKAPAGWYDDGSGRLRYWDGDNWTEHFAPLPPAAPAAPAAEQAPVAEAPEQADAGWAPPAETVLPEASVLPGPTVLPEATALPGDDAAPAAPEAAPDDSALEAAAAAPTGADAGPEIPYGSAAYGQEPGGWQQPDAGAQPTAAYPTEAFAGYGAPAAPAGSTNPAFQPGQPGAESPYGAQSPYGAPVAFAGQPPAYTPVAADAKKPNVLGFVALGIAVLGFIGVCIPFVTIIGLVLLVIAFVLAIVALFLKGRKWPALVGLGISVLGAILAGVLLVISLVTAWSTIPDQDPLPTFAPEASESPSDDGEIEPVDPADAAAFGETFAYDDGVELTVSEPTPYAPSEFAAGATFPDNVLITVTVTNNSAEPVDVFAFGAMTSGGEEGSSIFDFDGPEGEIGLPPTETLEPGATVTWKEAWSVADPSDLQYSLAPGFMYDEAVFTNAK